MAVSPIEKEIPYGRSAKKWITLRRLYECHGVGVGIIAELAQVSTAYVRRLVRRKDWEIGYSVSALRSRLASTFDKYIQRFNEDDDGVNEKAARSLAVMAKTLESLAAIDSRLNQSLGEQELDRKSTSHEPAIPEAERLQRLNQELEKILNSDEGARKTE